MRVRSGVLGFGISGLLFLSLVLWSALPLDLSTSQSIYFLMDLFSQNASKRGKGCYFHLNVGI